MNGIEPPRPRARHWLPSNTLALNASRASLSQGAVDGAFQPGPVSWRDNVTFAPYGTSVVSAFSTAASAVFGFTSGGRRKLSVRVVDGRSTLPASSGSGRPAAPMTDIIGRHALLAISSKSSAEDAD